jgi:hypothetical protein
MSIVNLAPGGTKCYIDPFGPLAAQNVILILLAPGGGISPIKPIYATLCQKVRNT